MERYFEKITKCMMGTRLQVDDETYTAVEGLRAVYAIVEGNEKVIVDGACAFQFEGEMFGGQFGVKVCEMNHTNRLSMNRHFRYTAPQVFNQNFNTVTVEDNIYKSCQAAANFEKKYRPAVFIHQKQLKDKNELSVCLDKISWSVFKNGNKEGYAVVLDGVKNIENVNTALENGISAIAVECSSIWKEKETTAVKHKFICFTDEIYKLIRGTGEQTDILLDCSCGKELLIPEEFDWMLNRLKTLNTAVTGVKLCIDKMENLQEYSEIAEHWGYKLSFYMV